MARSLVWKFTLMLAIVLATVMVIAAILLWLGITHRIIVSLPGQGISDYMVRIEQYYLANRSLNGLAEEDIRRQKSEPKRIFLPYFRGFATADPNGVLRSGNSQNYDPGERLSEAVLAKGRPLEIDGEVVAIIVYTYDAIYLSLIEALIVFLVIPSLVGLSLAFILARILTHPLRELTIAAAAVANGELGRQVPIKSQDEIGELSIAFNQMSHDLAEANQLQRQMTADIAHDLRTPLTVLGGYIDSAHAGFLSLSPDHLETMYGEIERMERMVSDLRLLARADAKQLTLNLQAISPQALLQRTANSYQHQASLKEITLSVEASQNLPLIKIDEEQMVRVLGNLVSNALRYIIQPQSDIPQTKKGLIRLASAIKEGVVYLIVEDNGQGIPPAHLPNIFRRFYRVDESRHRSSSQGESGLGLAIAKSLVEAHGGTITVESVLKQGTKFTIALPTS